MVVNTHNTARVRVVVDTFYAAIHYLLITSVAINISDAVKRIRSIIIRGFFDISTSFGALVSL